MAQIQLDDKLYQRLETIVQASREFKDVAGYAAYILEQVAQKKEQQTPATNNSNYSEADEEKIKARLKNLGYLD